MPWRTAMMYGRSCRLPGNPPGLVHKLDEVLVSNSGCSFHAAAFPVHDSNSGKPMTNIKQTLDKLLFAFDVDAAPDAVRRALTTSEGIASFWTDKIFAHS
jgi:hypothetical protein